MIEGKLTELTKQSIELLDDDELEYELFLFIIVRLIGNSYEKKYDMITKLPIGLRFLYASWQLEAEVLNGGFNQYFYNTSGEFIDEAIEAFNYFELPKLHEIIIKATDIAVSEMELHIETKKKGTLEAFSESYNYTNLGEADEEFYQYGNNISQTRVKKIRNNIEDFIL